VGGRRGVRDALGEVDSKGRGWQDRARHARQWHRADPGRRSDGSGVRGEALRRPASCPAPRRDHGADRSRRGYWWGRRPAGAERCSACYRVCRCAAESDHHHRRHHDEGARGLSGPPPSDVRRTDHDSGERPETRETRRGAERGWTLRAPLARAIRGRGPLLSERHWVGLSGGEAVRALGRLMTVVNSAGASRSHHRRQNLPRRITAECSWSLAGAEVPRTRSHNRRLVADDGAIGAPN